MKVVVVGLLKRQAQLIAQEFPGMDLHFANKESSRATDEVELFASADRLLMMTKFVSHALYQKMDRSKLTMINGGLTRLRDVLTRLQTVDRLQHAPLTIDEQFEDIEMKAKYDFTPLRHAKVGDVLVYTRDPSQTKQKFDMAVQVGRSYYKIHYGVMSEMHRKDPDTIEVLVTGTKPSETEIGAKIAREHAAQAGEVVDAGISEPAPALPPPAAPAAPEKPVLSAFHALDRQFWADVYLRSMQINPGSPGSWHTDANDAIDALRAKLGAPQ